MLGNPLLVLSQIDRENLYRLKELADNPEYDEVNRIVSKPPARFIMIIGSKILAAKLNKKYE